MNQKELIKWIQLKTKFKKKEKNQKNFAMKFKKKRKDIVKK